MNALTFVLEASLLAPLVEFATSSSGHVEPRQGLAFGWLGSVVAGLAVMFGTADRAQADSCYGIAEGSYGWVPTYIPCEWKDHKPVKWWSDRYYHHPGVPGCSYVTSICIA